mgnify:CR=1 FL=1
MKKHSFTVSGIIANILIRFNLLKKRWNINDLASLVGISKSSMLILLEQIEEYGLVIADEEEVTIIIDSKPASPLLVGSVVEILYMLQEQHGLTAFKDTVAVESSTKYVHKEHKFRIQSLIMKVLKKEQSMNMEDMHQKVIGFFNPTSIVDGRCNLLIDLTTEDIDQNVRDLCSKNFMQADEDLSLYEYIKD